MSKALDIVEHKSVVPYLEARGLLKQYKKAKSILAAGDWLRTSFKERQPKGSDIWSFRINKQFRAFGFFRHDGLFVVAEISNHQRP
jgi:plasmid maintenance system killer protein